MAKTRHHGRAAKFVAIKELKKSMSGNKYVKTEPIKPKTKKPIQKKRPTVKHPPFRILIIEALKALAGKNGSSIIAIKKEIMKSYVGINSCSVYVKKAVAKLLTSGIIKNSKNHPNFYKVVVKKIEKSQRKKSSKKKKKKATKRRSRPTATTTRTPATSAGSSGLFGGLFGGGTGGGFSYGPPTTVPAASTQDTDQTTVLSCASIDQTKYADIIVLMPYNVDLNLTDPSRNMDKFIKMQVVQTRNSPIFYWFVQSWGRNGTSGQSQTKGPFTVQSEATQMMEEKFKQKVGTPWNCRDSAGSTSSTGKYEIKKRLAAAGAGTSTKAGSIAISLMWDHSKVDKRNDLDLWVVAPSGEKIGYSHKNSVCGGELDVDRQQNAVDPVENIVWKEKRPKGKFEVWVQNYSANHTTEMPFHVSSVVDGGEMEMIDKVMPGENKKWIHIMTIDKD